MGWGTPWLGEAQLTPLFPGIQTPFFEALYRSSSFSDILMALSFHQRKDTNSSVLCVRILTQAERSRRRLDKCWWQGRAFLLPCKTERCPRAAAAPAAVVAGRDRRLLAASLLVSALPFAPRRIRPSKGRSIRMRRRRRECRGGGSEPPQARSSGPTLTARMGAARLCWGPSPPLSRDWGVCKCPTAKDSGDPPA